MTTVAIAYGSVGKHTPAYTTIRDLEADNRRLIAGTEEREREIYEALLRGCQDAMRIAQVEAEKQALLAANEELRHKAIKAEADRQRAEAEQERLRQAVINARPRIHQVDTQLVRPYSPVVALPYTSPVQWVDTSSEDTAELPVLDWPTYPATR